MEPVLLNKQFEMISVIDSYESFIWTDRFCGYGDFEIRLPASNNLTTLADDDFYLYLRGSDHMMIIEDHVIETSSEEGVYLTLSGRSLESILQRRIIWYDTKYSGNLERVIQQILNENVISPYINQRAIPNFKYVDSEDDIIKSYIWDGEYLGNTVYDVICEMCNHYNIGWKITVNSQNQFEFRLYSGVDRSYDQGSRYIDTIGQYGNGNIDLYNRPIYINPDGSKSTTDSISFFDDSSQIVIPTIVSQNNTPTKLSRDQAIAWYNSTHEYLGKFDTVAEANDYIERVEIQQKYHYNPANPGNNFVVFSPKFDNLISSNYATSIKNKKNICLIGGEKTTDDNGKPKEVVYAIYGDDQVSGLNRREIYYDGSGISRTVSYETKSIRKKNQTKELSVADYKAALEEKGKDALLENKFEETFDSEVDYQTMYIFGKDFYLGDTIEIINEFGINAQSKILEATWSENSSGLQFYPTFSTVPNSLISYKSIPYQEPNYIDIDKNSIKTGAIDAHNGSSTTNTKRLRTDQFIDLDIGRYTLTAQDSLPSAALYFYTTNKSFLEGGQSGVIQQLPYTFSLTEARKVRVMFKRSDDTQDLQPSYFTWAKFTAAQG